MDKLTSNVVATFVNAAIKNYDNALAPAIIVCHKCCLLSRKTCENIIDFQMQESSKLDI